VVEEVGYPAAKGDGWGEAGVARKGTAPGRIGEEKTGGPGGVLRCAGPGPGPRFGVPGAVASEKTRGCGGVKRAAWNGGDAWAGCGCGPGGVSSMPGELAGIGCAARRSEAEGRGGARIGSVRGAGTGKIRDPTDECDEVGFLMEIGFARPGIGRGSRVLRQAEQSRITESSSKSTANSGCAV
jgi:hypothetical protein